MARTRGLRAARLGAALRHRPRCRLPGRPTLASSSRSRPDASGAARLAARRRSCGRGSSPAFRRLRLGGHDREYRRGRGAAASLAAGVRALRGRLVAAVRRGPAVRGSADSSSRSFRSTSTSSIRNLACCSGVSTASIASRSAGSGPAPPRPRPSAPSGARDLRLGGGARRQGAAHLPEQAHPPLGELPALVLQPFTSGRTLTNCSSVRPRLSWRLLTM